jgi:hypothetical protein
VIGDVHRASKDDRAALLSYQKAASALEEALANDPSQRGTRERLASTLQSLALVLKNLGREREAGEAARRSRALGLDR